MSWGINELGNNKVLSDRLRSGMCFMTGLSAIIIRSYLTELIAIRCCLTGFRTIMSYLTG